MFLIPLLVFGASLGSFLFLICLSNVQLYIWNYIGDKPLILTPLLKENKALEAQELSRITPNILNSSCFSGYFTVNQDCESNLFFWFCQAQTNWEQSPVLLWLQGGPGCSSLMGLLQEIGPFTFKNGIAIENEHSWNKISNLLFIDQPVGTGFSFTNKKCFARNKTEIANDLYSAILQFYQLFPILKKNKFFLAGESYAGHYIPYIAHHLHSINEIAKPVVELSGIIIGNGWMDAYYQYDYGDLLFNLGFADEQDRCRLNQKLISFRSYLDREDWVNAKLDSDLIYETYKTVMTGVNIYNFLKDENVEDSCLEVFNNVPLSRTRIHVGSTEFNIDYDMVYTSLVVDNNDELQSVRVGMEELLEHYPIVFYFGQLDIQCSYSVALKFLRDLQWSGAADYKNSTRRRWCVNGKLAGYHRSAHNLHEVLVRNAGHEVPIDQPLWAFILANSVTSGPPGDPLYNLTDCEASST